MAIFDSLDGQLSYAMTIDSIFVRVGIIVIFEHCQREGLLIIIIAGIVMQHTWIFFS
jgi:hypothetical protein